MAEDCPDGDYLGAYSRFFSEFVAKVNPYDQLPVSVSSYNVTEAEIVGEIINVTLQYLNQTQCPASLQAHLVHQVTQEIKSMCKKQPEDCGFKSQEKTYTSLKLMQAITGKVNEICTRYLDNSRLALLPPPPSTPLPQIAAGGSKNCRRKMEDRYVVLHDLHSIFGIEDDSIANYYAVFDGHAGQDAAVYCASHLHQYLAESIYYPTDPERALRDAFLTTDRQFIEKSQTQKLCGGTTAVCTLILNKRLYVAWVGDSTAMLVKRDNVVQLVNPHRLHREDEVQRIRKMGGIVMQSMGTMRVNGVLGVSRAIGDVRYKPCVTGEPEIKSVPLDGTEDFLILASDGLTDYLEPAEILTVLYHEIQRNPNGFKHAYQVLLQWAKHAGSEDNITVIVVLLTPASAIAARPLYAHPYHRLQVNDILEKMNSKDKPLFLDIDDAHNAINSNILKHTMISQEARDHDDDGGILAASNGKHENGDADYDYSDLGPETNVDAIDDVATMPAKNFSYEFYKDDDENDTRNDENQQLDKGSNVLDNMHVDESTDANLNANTDVTCEPIADSNLRERDEDNDDDDDDDVEDEDEDDDDDDENENEENNDVDEDDDNDNDNDNDDDDDDDDDEDDDNDNEHDRNRDDNNDNLIRNEVALSDQVQIQDDTPENVHVVIREKMTNEVCELPEEERTGSEETRVKNDEQVDGAQEDVVDEAGPPVDYDDSPPSPQANKALRDAVIHEPDNVAESEDSEDEWNYYRVEPNKEKDSASTKRVDEPEETKGQVPEPPVKDIEPTIQPEDLQGKDIKCDNPKEEESQPELIDTEISTEDRTEEPERPKDCCVEEQEQDRLKDMEGFQLNPDAKEFVPVSPQYAESRMNLVEDYPVSGSPFKQVPEMDDIQVPSQSEFEKEVCQRPREVDTEEEKEYQNGPNTSHIDNYTDLISDQQRASNLLSGNMDDSEISSTKAEFGDESAVSFLTTSEFHRTGISAIDESFSSSERDYDIAKDPMAMSFTPSDFEAAFDKSVDLNAVHSLSNTDFEDQNGIVDREEEEQKQQQEQELERESPKVESTTAESKQLSTSNEQLSTSEKTVDELVNLSSRREHSEDNFIEHADETKAETNTVVDLLDLQPESSQLEQEEIAKYDHSPLTDNYSAGFESEKEPVSVDTNEQPLSPLSIDIDEKTKPIDEASEDAALPASDLQKEICSNEADTPSSLSPVPDPMESDPAGPVLAEIAQVQSSNPHQSLLDPDTSELVADDRCNFQSYDNELISHQRSPSTEVADVYQALPTKEETVDHYQVYSTEAGNAFELVQQDLTSANTQFDEKEDDKLIGTTSTVQQMNLLDFTEEQEIGHVKSPQFQSELTPPLSPQKPDEKPIDDVICSFVLESSSVEKSKDVVEETNISEEDNKAAKVTESVEEPMEPAVPTKTIEPVVDQVQEPTLNLSDSMQEFTGLENQLKPLEEEILKSKVDEQLEKEVSRKEDSAGIVAQPEILSEHTVGVECKKEVEGLLPEINKSEIQESEIQEPEIVIAELKSKEPQEMEIKKAEELEDKELGNKESEIKESEIKESKVEGETVQVEGETVQVEGETVQVEEEIVQVAENKAATAAAAAAAVTAAAATAAAAAATTQSKTKSKVSNAKPTKTTTSKAAAPKSMPTSPSKAAVSATRTSKKPSTTALSRPKDLDAPKKSPVSTAAVASKPAISKAASKTTTSTTTTKPITKTSASSVSKPKLAVTTASSRATLAEKKVLAVNGDVKPSSKSTATKPSSKSQPATKITLVKTSTTRMLTGTMTTTAKPRPTSASTTTVKSSTTLKSSSSATTTTNTSITATSSPRPKTAPAVGSTTKTRLSASKSPMIDKQVKETANKQISMGRTNTGACKTSSRSLTNTTTTTTVRRSTKTTTVAASPTKKSTTVTKVSKISSSGKTTTANNKGKVLQNGVSENVEINAILDDVPKKDLSPVVAPNDNQLIMSSD